MIAFILKHFPQSSLKANSQNVELQSLSANNIYFTLPGSYMFRPVAILRDPTTKQLHEDGDQPNDVGATYDEIYISIVRALVGTNRL
jgi:hypothetical protein